jgi:hypothetical protein
LFRQAESEQIHFRLRDWNMIRNSWTRWAAKLIIAALVSLTVSYVWTVAQTGLSTTDINLCELVRSWFGSDVPRECTPSQWIRYAWAALLFVPIVFVVEVGSHFLPKWEQRNSTTVPAKIYGGPDLPIRELFFYIDPDCLGNSGKNAIDIGNDILDKLSTGQIAAWGRDANAGRRPPLVKIGNDYWAHAQFNYSFFHQEGNDEEVFIDAEPRGRNDVPSYGDLQFNRAEVEAIWPIASRPPAPSRISVIDAVLRILESSRWSRNLRENPTNFKFDAAYPNSISPEERTRIRLVKQLNRDLHDRLRDGRIPAWGRPISHSLGDGKPPLRPIQKEEWDDILLALDDRTLNGSLSGSFALARGTVRLQYVDVKLDRSAVDGTYGLSSKSNHQRNTAATLS